MEPTPDGQGLRHRSDAIEGIGFLATAIRQERTGVHATITIAYLKEVMAWSNINVEKDEQRTRLANQAHKQAVGRIKQPKWELTMKQELDYFCRQLWGKHIERQEPTLVAGDAEPRATEFILEPYILRNAGTILFAPPGAGKSYTSKLMAIAVDSHTNGLWPTTEYRSLYVNLERSPRSIASRIGSVNLSLGLEPTRPLRVLNARGRGLSDVIDVVRKTVQDQGIGLVVLDSISRAGMGDLTENVPINRIIDALNSLETAWLAIGHTPRTDPTHVFGGILFDAGADIVIQLNSTQSETALGVSLQVVKANDIRKAPMQKLAYEFDDYGLRLARFAKANEFPELEMHRIRTPLEKVYDYLRNHGKGTATAIAEEMELDRANVSRLLRNNTYEFVVVLKEGPRVYYGLKARNMEGRM